MDKTYLYTVDLLTKKNIKHEVHTFQSGAKMIDIWYGDNFYVIQFGKDSIGLSNISKDNPGFDLAPDEKFYDIDIFKRKIEEILVDVM